MMRRWPAANPPPRTGDFGFTLLEAIVTLVILSTTGLAMFSWIESNLERVARLKAYNQETAAKEGAIEFMQTIDPMLRPEGTQRIGTFALQWQAKTASAVMDDRSGIGVGLYRVALYKTHVRVLSAQGADWFGFDLKQIGFKQVRQPSTGVFGI